jgi:hypothetical protein
MRHSPHASPGTVVPIRPLASIRRRILRSLLVLAALVGILPPSVARASLVSGLLARHHDGQTYLTWLSLPGTGWTYRVYRSSMPIHSTLDLARATGVGSVGDSSWCNKRLSALTGVVSGYRTDSTSRPLNFVRSMFVSTADDAAGDYYYAVTAQGPNGTEDRTVTPAVNTIETPVAEAPGLPRPVYQQTLTITGLTVDVYTLWASNHVTPFFPAMSNRESTPYDCAIVRGGPGLVHALVFRPHVRGGNYLQVATNMPGEWDLTMDDYLDTPDANTFWFGYNDHYDITSAANGVPAAGRVHDYTMQRVIFTLEWARRSFPIDPGRVYVNGSSMGGICGVFLAMNRPDLIAAVMVNVPRFDFSSESDPNVPSCAFNCGGEQRATCDRLWGAVGTGLLMEDGSRAYDRLNAGTLARGLATRYVPPIIAFNGRADYTVGWAEKIPFYRTMQETRAGGTFFWDTHGHTNNWAAAWAPMIDYRYLYRYRSDRSFPALSNCSADNHPGNGASCDGDSVGTINGYVEWDSLLVDEPTRWQVTLRSRDLQTSWGWLQAPEGITVDVTPRRLQSFVTSPYGSYMWTRRTVDGTFIGSGTVQADANGIVTIPRVPVTRDGEMLQLQPAAFLGVEDLASRTAGAPTLGPLANPVRGGFSVTVHWARDGAGSLALVDLAGREVRRITSGAFTVGPRTVHVDASGLASGIYFVTARQGAATTSKRIALVH